MENAIEMDDLGGYQYWYVSIWYLMTESHFSPTHERGALIWSS